MKSAQLPPIRVTPSVREEVERALRDGETLSEFVETTVLREVRRRAAQEEFLARGRASVARALKTGKSVPLDTALDAMEKRLQDRLATAFEKRRATTKP